MTENQDFKVVDRRASSGLKDPEITQEKASPTTSKTGEGFVMSDSPTQKGRDLHKIDFSTFILSLATGAFIHLGLAPDPSTGKTQKDLALAKQDIELLTLVREKTKGNLSQDEEKLFDSLLTEARLRYVDAS